MLESNQCMGQSSLLEKQHGFRKYGHGIAASPSISPYSCFGARRVNAEAFQSELQRWCSWGT